MFEHIKSSVLKITFLGTGTSQGVPLIGCECPVCVSTDTRDNRLRSSLMLEKEGKVFVIDSGPDFRQQMLRANVRRLDALIFTHDHKDHIAGMDDIRAFNYLLQKPVDIYATKEVQQALRREFHYIFSDFKYPGIPEVSLHTIDLNPFEINGIRIQPIEVMHYKWPVLGFRIGDFCYITDAKYISASEKAKMKGVRVLVLNALRKEEHISHFTLDEAVALSRELGPEQTWFTHISHQLGRQADIEKELPPGINLAHDGLILNL